MADNVVVSAGTGTTVAADEVVDGTLGTVKVQYVKIMDATLDGTTKAAVGANGLAVDVKALPTLAAVTTVSTVTNLAQLGGAAISMGTGVRGTGVQRVTVATDDLVPVTGTITAVTAITNALPTGTNTLGSVKVTDGTNTATVKAASTAPVTATDAAVVTVLRPDSAGIIATAALTAATAPAAGIATLAQYNATNPAPTDTQSVALQVDPNGKLLVQPYGNPANFVSGAITAAMTGTTTTSLVAAPAAGLRNYITTIICSNSHATVGTDIIIQDGSGGTTLLTIPAAAVYGGAVITLPTPLRQPTTATAIFCANVTTGASTKVSAVGYKGA